MTDANVMLSRVADSLFWLSRYLERAENTSRLLDVHLNFMLEASDELAVQRLRDLQDSLSIEMLRDCTADECLHMLTFDSLNPASIISNIINARENARYVREQISSEMWMQINKLYLYVKGREANAAWESAPHNFYIYVREGSHLFQGITDATMNHNQGWHFLQIGRYLERSLNLLQMLKVNFENASLTVDNAMANDHYFELVSTLKSVTAFEAYCKVYNPNPQPRFIVQFLLFDKQFPRSLRFCIDMIQTSLEVLADTTGRGKANRLHRVVGRLASNLSYDEISDVYDLSDYLADVKRQIYEINDTLFNTYITYPIESEL